MNIEGILLYEIMTNQMAGNTIIGNSSRTTRHLFGFNAYHLALTLFAVAVLLSTFSRIFADPDLWGHVRFGQDLLQTRTISQADPYSYISGDQPWINHEWLAEGIFALVYNAGGARGLVALSLLATITIVCLIYFHLRSCRLSPLRAWILIFIASFLIRAGMEWIRPQLFTYVFFASLMLILTRTCDGKNRGLWLLIPMFALWPNLHGGFLAGVGILILWLIVALMKSPSRNNIVPQGSNQIRLICIAVCAALLATIITPYGLTLWSFLLKTATVPRPDIVEWHPVSLISLVGGFYLLLLFLAIAAFIKSRMRKDPFQIIAFAVCAILPLLALRHLPLFAISLPFLSGIHIADASSKLLPSRQTPRARQGAAKLSGHAMNAVLLIGALVFASIAWIRSDNIIVDGSYPKNAVEVLKSVHAEGAMAVHFDWGEYIIWHLGPAVKVSVDGRRETVYSPERYQKAMNFVFGINDWKAVLKNEGVSMALVQNNSSTFNLMSEQGDWTIGYRDAISALFVKRGSNIHHKIRSLGSKPSNENAVSTFP